MIHHSKFIAGVTLIELLVTLSVLSILAGLSVPGMAAMLATSDVNNAQENIAQTLRKARSLAMAQGTITTVSLDSSANSVSMSVADGSAAMQTLIVPSRISFSESASIEFNPFGTATISSVSPTLTLVANGYSSIAPRTITITSSGQANVAR